MAKNSIREYSTTESNNTDIAGIGILGTSAVSNFDGALRTLMKQLADMNAGTSPINDTFALCDPADATKRVRIDAGNVAAGQTRVLTMPNVDVTISAFSATFLDDANDSTMRGTIGADNATNLTSGTVSDARLPGVMSAKNFSGSLGIGGSGAPGSNLANGKAIALGDNDTGFRQNGDGILEVYSNNALRAVISTDVALLAGNLTLNGNTVWNAANDGPGSGLDSDLLDGQHGAFYRNASNLNAGTVPDALIASNVVRRNTYGNGSDANLLPEGLSLTDGATLSNFPYNAAANNWRTLTIGTSGRGTQITQNYNDLNAIYIRGGQDGWSGTWSKIWGSNNDGAGSGLDADLLDGAEGSTYMSKAILTAAGSPPAGFVRFLGMSAGGSFNVFQQPTGGGAISVVTGW